MPRPAPRIALKLPQLALALALLALSACHVPTRRAGEWHGAAWEGGADGFDAVELAGDPCLAAQTLVADGYAATFEGGADGFTETGGTADPPACAMVGASGWASAGDWGVHRGAPPFARPATTPDGSPAGPIWRTAWGTPWQDIPTGGQGLGRPFIALWPGPLPDPNDPTPGIPPGPDLPDDDILLVGEPDPAPLVPRMIAEPATLALLGGALVVLGLLRRERV